MSPEFKEANQEDLDIAEFEHHTHCRDYQPERHIGDGIDSGLNGLGSGFAWFGFWVCIGLMFFGKPIPF